MESRSDYLVGYNSAGAFSTINHLHFQLFDIQKIKETLPTSFTAKPGHQLYQEYVLSSLDSLDPNPESHLIQGK